jgi:UrcA family protein
VTQIRYLPLVVIAAFAATPAAADLGGRRVSYADLDLTTPAGIAALDARLDQAVRRVCGDPYPRDLIGRRDVERCRAQTRASIQGPRSAALAEARSRAIQLAARGQ